MNKKHEEKPEEEKTNLPPTTQGGALAAAPDYLNEDDFGGQAGPAGFEGAGSEAYAIPFLLILQKGSPQVDPDDPKRIEGAKAGDFYNSVTKQVYDGKKGVLFIPCAFKRSFVEWGSRSTGGGFKGEYTSEQYDAILERKEVSIVKGRAYRPMDNGHVDPKKCDSIADTRVHYVLLIDPETKALSMAVLSLTSTQIKASRTLMTLLQTKKVETPNGKRTPPTFANVVKATTSGRSNSEGSWSGADFELAGMVEDGFSFNEAKKFYLAVNGGEIKADHAKADYNAQDEGEGVADSPQEAENF
jgi:hypothetical protein